ncbi:MAG TPA: AAA family ATPase [Cytophagaceae bacterium]|jgi:predicted ATPase|nr:AAA family ATPase [Cytophagaceae bacterium]
MVSELTIQRYKSILNQKIELRNLNILIGQNGAGKSNLISLFRFLERLSDGQLSDYIFDAGGINNFLFGGYSVSKSFQVKIEFPIEENLSNLYEFRIDSNGDQYRFGLETVFFWDKAYPSPKWDHITTHGTESNLKARSRNGGNYAKYIYDYIKDLKVYHFHDTSDNTDAKLPQDINDVYTFHREGKNIAPFLYYLRDNRPETYQKIVDTVRLVYPKFNDFVLNESSTSKGKIVLAWSEKGMENIYTAKQISDGTLRFICLATALILEPSDANSVPKTLIIDEPELGLHPFAINILADLIKKASINRQLIIATQSVGLLNNFMPEDLIIVEREKDGSSVFSRKENKDFEVWLDDYSLGQLWENNFLGGRP